MVHAQVKRNVAGEQGALVLSATGSTIKFAGYLAAFKYEDNTADDESLPDIDESPSGQEQVAILQQLQVVSGHTSSHQSVGLCTQHGHVLKAACIMHMCVDSM